MAQKLLKIRTDREVEAKDEEMRSKRPALTESERIAKYLLVTLASKGGIGGGDIDTLASADGANAPTSEMDVVSQSLTAGLRFATRN